MKRERLQAGATKGGSMKNIEVPERVNFFVTLLNTWLNQEISDEVVADLLTTRRLLSAEDIKLVKVILRDQFENEE